MQLSMNEMGQRELETGNTLLSDYAFISCIMKQKNIRGLVLNYHDVLFIKNLFSHNFIAKVKVISWPKNNSFMKH